MAIWAYAEIRVESLETSLKIEGLCSTSKRIPSAQFVMALQGRLFTRCFVRCLLAEWALMETAILVAGFRIYASTTAALELDEIPFEGIVTYLHAEMDGQDMPSHLMEVAISKELAENGKDASAKMSDRLQAAIKRYPRVTGKKG